MSDELLPCPFCGCEAQVIQDHDQDLILVQRWHVECMNPDCWCSLKSAPKRGFAIKRWNTRKAAQP